VIASSKEAFVRSLQRLVPEIGPEDVVPAQAGVRAQALMPAPDSQGFSLCGRELLEFMP
jgi:L-2-hydroxyglutarate oxidase LhgO